MATVNPFDLLGDDDNDDPSHLIAIQQQKIAAMKPAAAAAPAAAAKLPSKPLPPAQAVRESRNNAAAPFRGAGRGAPGRFRGGRGAGFGPNREFGSGGNPNGFYGGGGGDEGDAGRPVDRERGSYGPPRGSFRGGRRGGYGGYGGYGDGEAGGDSERPPRRVFERRSGTGRGNEIKRDGGGRGNWGTVGDDVLAQETEENAIVEEKAASPEKQREQEDGVVDLTKDSKESPTNEAEDKEKEQEEKEMTLEEYEKIREEKRKALLALKTEERKVELDKELKAMQQLSLKKGNDDVVFIKLGSDKEKKKENADREERVKKALSINEFLKPADGERYYAPGGRGRGRGRGDRAPFRGGFGGGFGGSGTSHAAAPAIEDPGQFPTLGGK